MMRPYALFTTVSPTNPHQDTGQVAVFCDRVVSVTQRFNPGGDTGTVEVALDGGSTVRVALPFDAVVRALSGGDR